MQRDRDVETNEIEPDANKTTRELTQPGVAET